MRHEIIGICVLIILISFPLINGNSDIFQKSPPLEETINTSTNPPENSIVYAVIAIDTELRTRNSMEYYERDYEYGLRQVFLQPRVTDSFGNQAKLTWYLQSDASYCEYWGNCGLIHDLLMGNWSEEIEDFGDDLEWHYHHVKKCGSGSYPQHYDFKGHEYLAENALNHLLIDKEFFPSSYRAGWVWEDNDLSNWLDDIVPFDFTNLAPFRRNSTIYDGCWWSWYDWVDGTIYNYDWSRAPVDSSPYHPSVDDYQTPGDTDRTIFYCNPFGEYPEKSFEYAQQNGVGVYCTYTHEDGIRPRYLESEKAKLDALSQEYGIPYKFVTADEAARSLLGMGDDDIAPEIYTRTWGSNGVEVIFSEEIYGEPYATIKKSDGTYERVILTKHTTETRQLDLNSRDCSEKTSLAVKPIPIKEPLIQMPSNGESWIFTGADIEGDYIFGVGVADLAGNTNTHIQEIEWIPV
ncbi:MAG: hypothetical protein ABIJ92_04115 [Candidatus Aenigmatarchaeota archaeon]